MPVACCLGLMGLILAVVGLYGLVAYSVSRRAREIGIGMAIGADRRTVVWMELRGCNSARPGSRWVWWGVPSPAVWPRRSSQRRVQPPRSPGLCRSSAAASPCYGAGIVVARAENVAGRSDANAAERVRATSTPHRQHRSGVLHSRPITPAKPQQRGVPRAFARLAVCARDIENVPHESLNSAYRWRKRPGSRC